MYMYISDVAIYIPELLNVILISRHFLNYILLYTSLIHIATKVLQLLEIIP